MKWIIICVLACGCSAQWHLQRSVKKDPSLLVADTVRSIDTVYLEVKRIDTLFKYRFDTVQFWKDSVFVKYFYQVEDSLVYLEVDCPDTPVITDTRIVDRVIKLKPTKRELMEWFGGGVIATLFLLSIFLIYWRIRNQKR